jgi:glycosyltransferase involved in cell wall biosynthesis
MTEENRLPKLSIGMPVWNGAPYIRSALDHILAQSFTDFELIISDNASTDATEEICRSYASADPRIRYIRQTQHTSYGENFQFVLSQARGRYYMWHAADDWWREGFFERAAAILDLDPAVVIVFSHFQIYDWTSAQYGQRVYTVAAHGAPKLRLLMRLLNPVANALYGMMRREAIDLAGVPFIDFWDLLFLNRMAVNGDLAIVSDDLFVAGTKASSPAMLANGISLRVGPYYREMRRLIRRHFRGRDRLLLWLVATRQAMIMYHHYQGRTRP